MLVLVALFVVGVYFDVYDIIIYYSMRRSSGSPTESLSLEKESAGHRNRSDGQEPHLSLKTIAALSAYLSSSESVGLPCFG